MKGLHFAKYQLPLLLWLFLIYGISAIPSAPVIEFPISPDKIAHAGIYFLLCLLSKRAFFHQEKWLWLRENSMLAALIFAIAYGVLDEVHQNFVPHRVPDIYDAMADALGSLLFLGWHRFRTGRRRKVI
ncbi:MAG TPA: VanZ family protein [Bacteroidota bacterium]|nr:VanZ family protein [Bacteroidota bacterium]